MPSDPQRVKAITALLQAADKVHEASMEMLDAQPPRYVTVPELLAIETLIKCSADRIAQ